MTAYFANTFASNGIMHAIPPWEPDFQVMVIRGVPHSSVNIFLDDLYNDLQVHDIPVQHFTSCIYTDTPDILIIPMLKRVILNGNSLTGLLHDLLARPGDNTIPVEVLDLTRFCNPELLEHYEKDIQHLEEKVRHLQNQSFQVLGQLEKNYPIGSVTPDMLFLMQSLFPVTAENTGKPEKVLATALTSSGWISNLQGITAPLKRRYILHGSPTFQRTFFQVAESRAENLHMHCYLIMNPLFPERIEGIIFPAESQAVLMDVEHTALVPGINDVELWFKREAEPTPQGNNFEKQLKLAVSSLIKAHSYREEMDEYYWYTTDLEKLFVQRRRMMHQLLALCDGQELWQYFV